MRSQVLALAALPLATQAVNLILSNDDGWGEINIRAFYNSLTASGDSIVLSAPAENQSGTGSSSETPTTVGSSGCEFSSCPAGSPATGSNSSMPRFNYVNAYPVDAMRYGIQTLSPKFFGGAPQLAVSGPNVGSNLGISVYFSGTVGAAVEAVKEGVPAIAFSGTSGDQTAWNVPTPLYAKVYADLATNITNTIIKSGTPYLPANTWLNVNFPASSSTQCSSASQFKFVLSRIFSAVPVITGDDVTTCNNDGRLPTESEVVGTSGCYAAISVGDSSDKTDQNEAAQAAVLKKLAPILSCLP